MEICFVETTFTPAEAEAISSVDVVRQRDLRRHEYLPKAKGGWTRFSIEDAARLLVIGKLAERGVKPSTSAVIANAKSAAVLVKAFALNCPGAVDDPGKLAREKP